MPAKYGNLRFAAQIAFFRGKVNVPTATWRDVWQSAHDQAFMVAGAAKADLLDDLRGAVDKAISEGTTLAQFRKDFDAIVARRGWTGWTGEGSARGRAWRTRVIYETNLRTSFAAGRWQQLQAGKRRRPWLQYIHDDSVRYPRPLHQSWDGLVLHIDDPWWRTHYPPNGWGCKCKVRALNDRDLRARGLTPGEAPASPLNPKTGAPEGIDAGFAYAPGASIPQQLGANLRAKRLPPGIKQGLLDDIDAALGQRPRPPTPPAPAAPPSVAPPPPPTPIVEAQQWHNAAWNNAPAWLTEVVATTPLPKVTVKPGKGSWHSVGNIQMGYRLDGSARAVGVWRHEFGHYLDHLKGRETRVGSHYSSGREFTAAMKADARDIADGAGRGRRSKKQAERLALVQSRREAVEAEMLSAPVPEQFLRDLAADAGVDYDQFRVWVSENGYMATMQPGVARLSLEARALEAIRLRDAQGLLDAIDGQAVAESAWKAKSISYKAGSAGELSDLFSAATLKKVEGCGAHSAGYYRQRRGYGQQTECAANLTCILGTGPFGRVLLERFTPRMLDEWEKVFRNE